MLKWEWNKSSLSIYRRTNINPLIHNIHDTNFSVIKNKSAFQKWELVLNNIKSDIEYYERIVTYEGPSHLSIEDKIISQDLTKEIKEAIDSIVDHLAKNENFLYSAEFYFKQDKFDDLVLIFVSNIKFDRFSTSDLIINKSAILTTPYWFDKKKAINSNKKLRPASAKIASDCNLSSKIKSWNYCIFWEEKNRH